jgi:hypothetical protein
MPARQKILVAFIITLAIFLFFRKNVIAATVSAPSNIPSEVQIGTSFAVNGSLTNVSQGQVYFLKCRLGPDSSSLTEGQTYNQRANDWLSDSSAWVNMPIIEILGDPANFSLDCRIKSGVESGSKVIFLRACLEEPDGSCKGNFQSNTGISFTALVEPTSTPTHTQASPIPTSTPTSSPPNATYKINEAKDKDGSVLSSVKVYVDGSYLHHYAPETITFCQDCFCDSIVACGFGTHLIELQKSGYQDWEEERNFATGDSFEVNPEMEKEEETVATSTSTPTLKLTPTPTKKATPTQKLATESGLILGEESSPAAFYPLEATEEGLPISTPEAEAKNRLIAKIFLLLGFFTLFGSALWVWYTQLREKKA